MIPVDPSGREYTGTMKTLFVRSSFDPISPLHQPRLIPVTSFTPTNDPNGMPHCELYLPNTLPPTATSASMSATGVEEYPYYKQPFDPYEPANDIQAVMCAQPMNIDQTVSAGLYKTFTPPQCFITHNAPDTNSNGLTVSLQTILGM